MTRSPRPGSADDEPVLEGLEDADLINLVHQGHKPAAGVLFARYRYAAERLARHLGMGFEANDVVAYSFEKINALMTRGLGPTRAFRAYLMTTIRHESGRRAKARRRVVPTSDDRDLDTTVALGGGHIDAFEATTVRQAFESLPQRWRSVLWALDVEGLSPRSVGVLNHMKPNAVSALAYRARGALRESYLDHHSGADQTVGGSDCEAARHAMAAVVRRTSDRRSGDRVAIHVDGCTKCSDVLIDLHEINRKIGGLRG